MRYAGLLGVVFSMAVLAACGGRPSPTVGDGSVDAAAPDALDASTAKGFTSFAFLVANNPALAADVDAPIAGTAISAKLPFVDVTGLKATFTTTGASVAIGGAAQVSGVTANDFTRPVTYTVTAADHSTMDFTVTASDGLLAPVAFPTGANPDSVAIADVNVDGKPDLAVVNASGGTVSIFLDTTGSGATTPTFAAKLDLSAIASSVAMGDLNGDGEPDLVVVVPGTAVSVFLDTTTSGATTPSFAAKVDFAAGLGAGSVAIADLNGDGEPDLAVVNACSNAEPGCSNSISVFLNTTAPNATTPSFAAKVDFPTAATNGYGASLAIADLNGDGKPDLAYANGSANRASVFLNTTPTGATTPSFAANVDFTTGSGTGTTAEVGDLNGDGKPDLVVANGSSNTISVLFNTTSTGATIPSFAAKVDFPTGTSPFGVAIADFNGDAKPDLVVPDYSANTVSVFMNTTAALATTPTFAAKVDFPTGASPFSIALGDFNSDGKPDIAVANVGSSTVSVLLHQ